MAKPPSPALDDSLAKLGRDWFAAVREKDRAETKAARSRGDVEATGDAGADLLDWLLNDGEGGDGND